MNGEDLTSQPLLERKNRLKRVLPARSERTGTQLFQAAVDLDLEGIVAKKADSPYALGAGRPPWVKIKNRSYSQNAGRHELFERRPVHRIRSGAIEDGTISAPFGSSAAQRRNIGDRW